MNHSDIQSRMARYLDGDLSLDARALFDAHLDRCEACSRELSEMRDTIRVLRSLPAEEPPLNFVSDVMARIAEGEGQPSFWGRLIDQASRVLVPRIAIPISAVAAALTLTVMSGDLSLGTLNLDPATSEPGIAGVSLTPRSQAPPSQATQGALAAPTRVATVTAETRARQAESIRVSNTLRNARMAEPRATGGAASFLYRVANDRTSVEGMGPIRRMPSEHDVASRLLFMGGGTSSRPGPYFGASAAPSIDLGSTTLLVNGPSLAGAQATGGLAPVAVTRLVPNAVQRDEDLSAEQLRNRELDARLRFLEVDPPGFAQRQAQLTLAEQELWMREIAARAEELGDVERVLSALEGSGDPESSGLALAFESAVKSQRESWAASGASQASE